MEPRDIEITQDLLDSASFIVIGGRDGLYEWSTRSPVAETADWLEQIAAEIRSTATE